MTKSNLEGFVSITVPHQTPSLREVSAGGLTGQKLKAEIEKQELK